MKKDGMWAVLAWLQILATKTEAKESLVTSEDVAKEHWKEDGRNYDARCDYEGVDKPKAEEMTAKMAAEAPSMADAPLGGMEVKFVDMSPIE